VVAIGPHTLPNNLVLAPMARHGSAFPAAVPVWGRTGRLRDGDLGRQPLNTRKSRLRMDHTGEPEPIAVQIAGGDAPMLAEAARLNEAHGARIIDINMGCPAKKVCNKAAGSALMRDEALVSEILSAVTAAVDVPVTPQNAHRLGPGEPQCRHDCPHGRGRRHQGAVRPRAHAGGRLQWW